MSSKDSSAKYYQNNKNTLLSLEETVFLFNELESSFNEECIKVIII